MFEKFWAEQAEKLPWLCKWDKILQWDLPYAKWFLNGQINASHVCIDQHINNGNKDKIAIHFESETGEQENWTYQDLYEEINKFSKALKNLGLQKNDKVILYLPMIPQAIVAMLSVARLGAIHSVVFSGFSAIALKERILDTGAKFIITADFTTRRNKLINLKEIVDNALEELEKDNLNQVQTCIIINRNDIVRGACPPELTFSEGWKRSPLGRSRIHTNDKNYHDLISPNYNPQTDYIAPVPVESNHPLFILYTSGTTGKPKGIMHSTGGYLTYVYSTFKWAFNPDQDSIYWCTADIGWITGHSFLVYAPLAHGLTIVLHEGSPDHPTHEIWWQIIEKYKVNIFYTSPTALRLLAKFGTDFTTKYNLRSLKTLGSVGEPLNPEVWHWYNKFVGNFSCPIIDTWWQTETGGFMISPKSGLDLVGLKPGSATHPMPHIDVFVVDNFGQSVLPGNKGYLVIKNPWPGLCIGIHNDQENKFFNTYWSKFPGFYYSGDYAIKDQDGYFWILGRADEVLNVSGHRIGTSEIESAILKTEFVAEAAVIGIPDEIKGEALACFVVAKQEFNNEIELKKLIIEKIKIEIGSFAKPKEIFFVKNLPKTRSGKIMRRLLKTIAENKNIGDISTLEDADSLEEIKVAIQNLSLF